MAKRILIVDDAAVIRDLISLLLTERDYTVTLATNGRQAYELLKSNSFDLVIADLNMPEMDGVALTRAIRADPALAGMPIIMVTANDFAARLQEAQAAGITEYLLKPFNNKELVLLVSQLAG